jgi:hypothetical protein
MKSIPLIPTGLLFLLCVLNFYLGIISWPDPHLIMFLVFGIVYLTLDILVIRKMRTATWLGFIIPLAILFIYPLLVDFKQLNPVSAGFLGATNGLVTLYFLYMLLMKL